MAARWHFHLCVGGLGSGTVCVRLPLSDPCQENILLGLPMDAAWYERVIDCCCLRPDLDSFDLGDQTEVRVRAFGARPHPDASATGSNTSISMLLLCYHHLNGDAWMLGMCELLSLHK